MATPNRGPDGRIISKAEAERLAESNGKVEVHDERERARSRGIPESQLDRWQSNVFWGVSGRTDDRVVLFERDPMHPGGEAFIAGPTPDFIYKTGQVNQLLMQGLIVEVPEPKRTVKVMRDGQETEIPNPRYPVNTGIETGDSVAAQPGRPIPLGRTLDPELFDAADITAVERRLSGRPTELTPTGAYVPSASEVERPA
jgi:hypothetical protein